MPSEFNSVFLGLRAILERHSHGLLVTADAPDRYCLEGWVGPATLLAWGGRMRRPQIPVAWIEIGKTGVSDHVMGIHENGHLQRAMSRQLKARLKGKACFNFKTLDDASLANELEQVTATALRAFRTAGFIVNEPSA